MFIHIQVNEPVMALYYHSSKESMARNIPGMTHVPLNSPHILSPSPILHASRHQKKSTTATRKSHFPPNGQAPVRSLRNQNAMQHAMSMYSQSSEHTPQISKKEK
jgi:hypothetical protein